MKDALFIRFRMASTRPWLQAADVFLAWPLRFLLLVALTELRNVNAFTRTPKLAQFDEVCETDGCITSTLTTDSGE